MPNFDDLKLAVEAISGGKNTVLFDDTGMPSIMVVIPKMKSKDLLKSATDTVHPAFVLNDIPQEKVAISKYQNIVFNDRAYSLPMQDPRTSINYEGAITACRKKGEGWGLTPFALWSAIALWCKKNKTMPNGNNQWGKDITNTWERGVQTSAEGGDNHKGETARCATGSGPSTWYHDHTRFGIADLNGNVWEWTAGMRLKDGEIQIIPYADCMKATCDMTQNSVEWQAIDKDGRLIAPKGAAKGSFKLDYKASKVHLITGTLESSEATGRGCTFGSATKDEGVSTVPQLLLELALFHEDDEDEDAYNKDYYYIINQGERLPVRGGGWNGGTSAGVFHLSLYGLRTYSSGDIGFRSAFYGKL